jgi:cysteinyl-tRNA synthetase
MPGIFIILNEKIYRNYLCNDMIRRVLRDHFGYNIQYCMNITDVDDKIINRSND